MKNKQSGFSNGIIILLIIVLTGLGFIGWRVVEGQTKIKGGTEQSSASMDKTSTASDTDKKDDVADTPAGLVVKEWGVEIVPARSLPSVTYKYEVNELGIENIGFAFRDLPDQCRYVYGMWRATANQKLDDNGNTSSDYDTTHKVGDYYYVVHHGQAGCEEYEQQNQLVQQFLGYPAEFSIKPLD